MKFIEMRNALYHRLHWLWPVLAHPWSRRLFRLAGVLLVLGYFTFIALILGLRYWALPKVATHQLEIQQMVGKALGMPVQIDKIEADWQGLNPRLTLTGVQILDRERRPALSFDHVEGVLSWRSLIHFAPIMDLLAIDRPVLDIRRDASGRVTVAGIDAEGETDPRVIETLLKQRRIRIRNATLQWTDEQRGAPPLVLEDVQFGLDNRGSRHRFGLSAVPPEHLASRLELRGELHGDLLGPLDRLSGKIFTELDYVDLAAWRAWVNYPFRLRQGRGALRLWGDWDAGYGGVTADLALEDVQLKLGDRLPELPLASLRGRLQAHYGANAWSFAGKKLELSTLSGIRMAPTDLQADWRKNPKSDQISGSASASLLDLKTLHRLADYLPLDARSRELLTTHQPQGRIADLRASWDMASGSLKHYALKGRFDEMAIQAAGVVPGGKGISGEVDASEKGGFMILSVRDGGIDLPSVFPESFVPLTELRAKTSWKIEGKKLALNLERIDFSSPDATGVARGIYQYDGSGPGEIDLSASISQADGRAAWRYMPRVVGDDTRDWLRRAIVSGTGSDARLTLRGNLRDFPFRDPAKGIFLITAKARDVRLKYAESWPAIEGLYADMRFGVGMRIESTAGTLLGTKIQKTVVEIPDFDVPEEQLVLNGRAEGPTNAFLDFIEQSPVKEAIDGFTEGMRASGNAELALKLDMPLRHLDQTRINGEFAFAGNQITVMPGLPVVSQAKGKIDFTEKSIVTRDVSGTLLGAPMRLSAKNEGAQVQLNLSGGANARELRKFVDQPALDHLSGSVAWKGELQVRKKTASFVIESNLVGLSSSLPEPFNKSANAALPLRIEKTALPKEADGADRDQVRVLFKGLAEVLVQRREKQGVASIERGAIAVNAPLPALPQGGIDGDLRLPRLDADFWRKALASPANTAAATGDVKGSAYNLRRISLQTPQLRLYNRDFNAVELLLSSRDSGTQINITAKEAAGEILWQEAGKGSLRGDFKRLLIPAEAVTSGSQAAAALVDSLPAVDLRVADLVLGEKRLGRLEAKAQNTENGWQLDSLLIQNPDGNLKGKGEWRLRGAQQTRLDFDLTASDAGKLLERLGYVGSVRRGSAHLKGKLAWDGPLPSIHYPSLSGDLEVKAEKGQFAKLEPGFGKLLGLISLQSLPRRLSLDFRDIFSDGLAFDSIEGNLAIKGGIMRTVDDFRIDSPSARILIRGETDLKQETQNLQVNVQPEVSGVASIGMAALAHPAIGAAAWVVNKVFQNPLNRVFAFQYQVTGTWADPKVEKEGAAKETRDTKTPEKGVTP